MRTRGPEPILFLLLALAWGSSYVALKIGVTGAEPAEVVAVRLAIGAAVLGLVARLRAARLPARHTWPHVAVVAFTGLVLPFLLISWGQRGVDAGLASVFNAAVPLATLGLAAVALADEPLQAGRALGIATGFVGIAVVAGGGVAGGGEPASIAALALGVLSYALTAVYARRTLRGTSPLGLAAGQAFVGLAFAVPLALLLGDGRLAPSPATAAALGWLGVVGSGLGPLLFFRLLAVWGANRTSLVNYAIPLVGVGLGVALLGETLEPRTLLGGAIVAGGMAIASLAPDVGAGWIRASARRALAAGARG